MPLTWDTLLLPVRTVTLGSRSDWFHIGSAARLAIQDLRLKNRALRGSRAFSRPCGRARSVQGQFVNGQVAGVIRVSVPFREQSGKQGTLLEWAQLLCSE